MKKIRMTALILAVAFAVGSSFTVKDAVFTQAYFVWNGVDDPGLKTSYVFHSLTEEPCSGSADLCGIFANVDNTSVPQQNYKPRQDDVEALESASNGFVDPADGVFYEE